MRLEKARWLFEQGGNFLSSKILETRILYLTIHRNPENSKFVKECTWGFKRRHVSRLNQATIRRIIGRIICA